MTRRAVLISVVIGGCSSGESGATGDRPIAVITDPFRDAVVGSPVSLEASDSYDPDNAAPLFPHGIESFVWTLDAPAGSVASIAAGTSGTAVFVADVAGTFGGELVVVDVDGRESAPAPFEVVATPIDPESSGLFVRLAWGENGSDFDLHLVQAGGTYRDPFLDCHYANTSPDWGAPGLMNDPSLEDDVSAGPGPETIRVNEPQQTSYAVFAHLFSDNGFGAQAAEVTIAFDGNYVAEATRDGIGNNLVWEVGTVVFANSAAAPTFTLADETFPNP